jgi:hypothetical protein
MPKIVLIADWCNWVEETSIEGCVGPNGWKDLNGNPTYDWYMQITQAYSTIFKSDSLPANTFVKQDGYTNVYFWNGSCLNTYSPSYKPNGKPIIELPASWLQNHGYWNFCGSAMHSSGGPEVSSSPNPFNPSVNILFNLPHEGDVKLQIYDILGRKVATLVNGPFTQGKHEIKWVPVNQASGTYFYRLTWNGQNIVKKILFLK